MNEGTHHYIVAWWETNKKSRHLNQRFYDMQVPEQGDSLFNLAKRYEGFNLIVGGPHVIFCQEITCRHEFV
jgi:hypothetical protein